MALQMILLLKIMQMVYSLPEPGINLMMKAQVNDKSIDGANGEISEPTCPIVTCEPCPETPGPSTPITTEEATTPVKNPPNPILDGCDARGGVAIGNECVFFSDDELSWKNAGEMCLQNYGPLSTPADPWALRDYVATVYPKDTFWVGAYSLASEKTFEWLNGTQIPLDRNKFPWAQNEPSATESWKYLVSLVVNKDGYDARLASNSRSACRLDACGMKGGSTVGYQCIVFKEEEASWDEAVDICASDGGQLLVPTYPQYLKYYDIYNTDGDHYSLGGVNGKDGDHYWLGGLQRKGCKDGAVYVGGQCLRYSTDALSWDDAKQACSKRGSQLAAFNDPSAVLAYTEEHFQNVEFWGGASDTKYEGTWQWITGGNLGFYGSFPWGEGQPDNLGGHQDCLIVNWVAGGYDDKNCEEKKRYICEYGTWYWLNGDPFASELFPPGEGECLDITLSLSSNNVMTRQKCSDRKRFICELGVTSENSDHVAFLIRQFSSGKFMGPNTFFPHISSREELSLHYAIDPNMVMTFDIINEQWGYIRHVKSGLVLYPYGGNMEPKDGTRLRLSYKRRPWALFSLDQYRNRIIHRSGKVVNTDGKYIILSDDIRDNDDMNFQFMNPRRPSQEVLPYGYAIISGDWIVVFSVLNPLASHTYSSIVTTGKSKSRSTSNSWKYGFEVEDKAQSYFSASISVGAEVGGDFLFGSASVSTELTAEAGGSSEHTETSSFEHELAESSSGTWSTETEKQISFTVEDGKSVAVWQRVFIAEKHGHKSVYLSNIFADTNSSRINPNNFKGYQNRRGI